MSDPLIEGIANPGPKPGITSVVESLQNYVLPTRFVMPPPNTNTEGVEESLAILTSLGTAKDYLGVKMSFGDVQKLSAKDVEKYHYRYQSILGKQVTGGMVENTIKLFSRLVSKVISIDNGDALSNDILQDELVKRELSTAAGYLVLKGGRFVALASALFHVVNHLDFTIDEKILVEKPPEQPAENS